MGHDWTQAQANAALSDDLDVAAERLHACIGDAPLSEHQYAALLSLVYNVGADPKWTIWKLIRAHDYAAVPDQIQRFDKITAHGVTETVPGLAHRRLAEVQLWNTPDVPAALATIAAAPMAPPSSSITRNAITPPAPLVTPPQTRSIVATGVTAVVATGSAAIPVVQQVTGAVHQVADAVAPYADSSHVLGSIQSTLALVLAGLSVTAVALVWITHIKTKEA